MKIGRSFLLTTVPALLLLATTADAQDVKIGLIDFGRLMSESPQAIAIQEAHREEFAPRVRDLNAMQTELQEKQKQIQRDLEVMGPEERRNSEQQLRKEERDLTRKGEELNEDLNLRRNEALGKLQRVLISEAQGFARNEGFDLVVSSEGVIYVSPVIDITEQVLERLKVSFAAQPAAN